MINLKTTLTNLKSEGLLTTLTNLKSEGLLTTWIFLIQSGKEPDMKDVMHFTCSMPKFLNYASLLPTSAFLPHIFNGHLMLPIWKAIVVRKLPKNDFMLILESLDIQIKNVCFEKETDNAD